MASKSLVRNYIYDLLYRIIYIISPLITAPYISRVIGAEGIGDYSYTQSVCSYFALSAILGTNVYGQREIAFCCEHKDNRSKVFWEIFFIRMSGILISTGLYLGICIRASGTLQMLFLIQTVDIFGLIFDITWLLQGVEEFGILLYRNVVIKILSIVSIFVFVKSQQDLYLYVLLTSAAVILGNLSVWPQLHKYVAWVSPDHLDLKRHLAPACSLFLPAIALRLYDAFDKTMLGLLVGSSTENGFYEQALKIITIAITAVTSLGNVMSPRMAALYSQNDKEKLLSCFYGSVEVVWVLALPVSAGTAAISGILIPWFLGEGYDQVIALLRNFSLICVAMGLKNVIGLQYLVPTKRQDEYTRSILAGLVVNIMLNGILIPYFHAQGAVTASVISEYFIVLAQLYMIRKDIQIGKIMELIQWKLMAALMMGGAVFTLSWKLAPTILHTVFLIIVGGILYFGLLLLWKDTSIIKLKDMIQVKAERRKARRRNGS